MLDSGILWADLGLDITADVIKQLDAAAAAAPQEVTAFAAAPLRRSTAASRRGRFGGPAVASASRRPPSVRSRSRVPVPTITRLSSTGSPIATRRRWSTRSSSTCRGRALVAVKNVTVSEEFFQGHFPGAPLMPGVLMIESLAQAAAILLLDRDGEALETRAVLRGVDDASSAARSCRAIGCALERAARARAQPLRACAARRSVGDQVVAEAELLMALVRDGVDIHPTATCIPARGSAPAPSIGPHATIGAHVRIGRNCRIGASAVVDGWTELGDDTRSSRSRRSACGRRT